jgi:uncharacterized membrane protein YphA (DoxX/SURF4 family)
MRHEIDKGNANKLGAALWTVQIVLALVFLFAGGMKLVLPANELVKQTTLPALFLRFIGLCEILGALGLILPGLLGIRRGLTPLAAAGLVIIMIGATVMTLAQGQVGPALVPIIVGSLATFVVYRHRRSALRAGEPSAQAA